MEIRSGLQGFSWQGNYCLKVYVAKADYEISFGIYEIAEQEIFTRL